MSLVHLRVSVTSVSPKLSRSIGVLALMLANLSIVQPVWCAESDSNLASIVSDNISTAKRRQFDDIAVTPEVSAVHARLNPSTAPLTVDGRPLSELAGVNYKIWMSRGRAAVGVGVGTLGHVASLSESRGEGPAALNGASATVSVGVRYRVTPDSAVYADASGAQGLGADPAATYINTKVGLEWKPAKQTFGFERGAIGMHFDSGYRLSVKPRRGGLALYLRGQF